VRVVRSEYECMKQAPAFLVIVLQNQEDTGPIVDGILIPDDPVTMLLNGQVSHTHTVSHTYSIMRCVHMCVLVLYVCTYVCMYVRV
jgi:hypothetical protein